MKNKKLIQRGLGVILLSLMSLMFLLPVFVSAEGPSLSLKALGKSGNLWGMLPGQTENATTEDYESIQSASAGYGEEYPLELYPTLWIGQGYNSQLGYVINRSYLYFDLSSIPSNATITGATLSLTRTWGEVWDVPQTFHILAFNGQTNNHPSDILSNEDYDLSLYADNETTPGWELDTADFTGYDNNTPSRISNTVTEPFNSTGLGWIETQRSSHDQELRLCLVSDQDWQAIAPLTDDQICFTFASLEPTLRNIQRELLASLMSPFLDNRLLFVEEDENFPEIEIEYEGPPPTPPVNSLGGILPIAILCLYILWALFFLSGEITLKNIVIVVVGAVIILAFVGTVAGMIAIW